jgi:F420-dependent oxidoreductase-like protein
MRVALMIEGQEDVTWQDWVALADACERSGIEALFRSDHYSSVMGEGQRGSLDAWATINALAARTTTLRLGTMVSPTSFRHPSILAKAATTADHVSDGRIELGMGTGWSEIEHTAYGFPFLSMKERMDVLEEQLAIVHDGHWGEGGFSFHGDHYTLVDLDARPKPVQRPHPPLIMGGGAGPRAARLAARFADEYNTNFVAPDEVARRKANIDAACQKAGRDPIPFSFMTGTLIGGDQGEVDARRRELEAWASPPDPETGLVGTVEQVAKRLQEYKAVGVSRVYLQWMLHRDIDAVELIGRELVPAIA